VLWSPQDEPEEGLRGGKIVLAPLVELVELGHGVGIAQQILVAESRDLKGLILTRSVMSY